MANAFYRRVRATAGGNALYWRTNTGQAGALTAAAFVIATANGTLTTQIPLATSAVSVVTATGSMVFSGQFASNALAEALAQGNLTTQIRLAAAAAAQVTATGGLLNRPPVASQSIPTLEFTQGTASNIDLSGYGSDPDGDVLAYILSLGPAGLPSGVTYNQALKRLEYSGAQVGATEGNPVYTDYHRLVVDDSVGLGALGRADTTVVGNILFSVNLSGSGAAVATATGLLTQPADLVGAAQAEAIAAGALTTEILVTGAAAAVFSASGTMESTIPLNGAAGVIAVATGDLSLNIPLTAAVLAQLTATGALTTQITLSGVAVGHAVASGGFGAVLEGAAPAAAKAGAALTTAKARNRRLVMTF